MSKKDYEKAALIAQGYVSGSRYEAVVEAFATLFLNDGAGTLRNRFDAYRFRRACVPGANVRARS